jgi:hypothetical protein
MSEATPEATAPAPEAAPESTQEPSTSTPPWGDDFDPQTAWDKIQKANREAANLRQRAITPEQQQQLDEYQRLVEASKSEQQRQAEALEAERTARQRYESEALRYRVAAEHGIGRDDLDLLGSGTEEELTTRAQRIAELRSAATQPPQAAPAQPGQRPVERLLPGASPTAAVSEDDANYTRLFGADAP